VHQAPSSRPLVETAGPEPETPLSKVRLAIGSIGSPHGTEGDLRLRLLTDDPQHLLKIRQVWVGDETQPRQLLSIRFHTGLGLIRLSGVRNPDDARALLGQMVRISGKDARPLAAGEFYFYQVIGLTAYDEAGAELGIVTDIMETGANDVFVITPGGDEKEMLLPNIPSVILEIDSKARKMIVRPLVYWESPAQPG
jgi:16S rRNA processing protein RimM